jgi:hypothetical protein
MLAINYISSPCFDINISWDMMPLNRQTATLLGIASLLLAAAAIWLWFRQVNLVALPEDRTLFVAAFIGIVVMGLSALVLRSRWFGVIPALLAIIASTFMTATIYISPQQVADNPIKVGDTIPTFVALNDQGERFNSNTLSGKPTLIKFFRGHW